MGNFGANNNAGGVIDRRLRLSGQYCSVINPKVDGQHVLSMYFLFYVFDGRSVAQLTGSMFFLMFLLWCFRLMVGCEVDGHLWAVLCRFRGLCERSWAALGTSAGGLGPLLGPVGGLGPLLGPLWEVLGRS